jgi:hypothetical protein
MFGRRNNEKQTPIAEIPVLEGRTPNVLRGHEDNPEQPVRILSQYGIDDMDSSESRLQMELIWAQTATEPKRIKVEDINEILLTMSERVIRPQLEGVTQQFGRYIIEYPRAQREDPTRGDVFVLGRRLTDYSFVEQDGEITVTGHRFVESVREKVDIPAGSRMTAAVTMSSPDAVPQTREALEAKNVNSVVNTGEPTEEENFTRRVRDAIGLYRTMNDL